MLARKTRRIRGLRRAPRVPRELLLGRIQKAHRPAARQQRGRALIEAAPRARDERELLVDVRAGPERAAEAELAEHAAERERVDARVVRRRIQRYHP